MMCKKVIVDVDVGTDDAFALLLLLMAEKRQQVEILAVTCVNGNTSVQNVYKNVKRLLRMSDREDIPVYVGASSQLINADYNRYYFHGFDGMGDLQYDIDDMQPIDCPHNKTKIIDADKYRYQTEIECATDDENAINALNELAQRYPNEISLLCLGPLTNIALALRAYSNFANKIKDCFIMGGNHKGVGNVTSSAEFNFHSDPEAAFIVLNSKLSLNILTWETCLDCTIPFDWRLNVLGKCTHPVIRWLNAAEHRVYEHREKYWNPCDALLVVAYLYPEIIVNHEEHNVSVELQGAITRGQMVLDHKKKKSINAKIITELNFVLFQQKIVDYLSDYL